MALDNSENRKTHQQTWAKVNVPVDVGVVGLVEALSSFPKLETTESCQGDNKVGPWVSFRYGEYGERSWEEISEFVLAFLAPGLKNEVGDDVMLSLRLNAFGNVKAEIQLRPGSTVRVVPAILRLRDTI